MHRGWLVILGILLVTGCDSRLVDPNARRGEVAVHTVSYRVEGTYVACTIRYVGELREVVTVADVALPWEAKFSVTVQEKGAPFGASVRATCADPDKLGKSVATVFVDGKLKDRGSATGFGATSWAVSAVTVGG